MLAYLNGEFLPKKDAKISVEDRGFIFGDGVYEVWRVIGGRLFEHERHFARLQRGLKELRIPVPAEATLDGLQEIGERLFRENDLADGEGTLYLEITRGAANRAHQFPSATTKPTIFAMSNPFVPPHELRAKGATAIRFEDLRWGRCDIKTIQLLPNVMAKQAAAEKGALEAVFIRDGFAIEGSHSNLMAVLNGELRTHPANNRILRGITRDVILELAREAGIPVREEPILESDIAKVEELFFTGTTTDVTPVIRVDDTVIGSGKPGPIATSLLKALQERMAAAAPSLSSRS
jgi:D-alanine transaminase